MSAETEFDKMFAKAAQTVNESYRNAQLWMEPAAFSLKRVISSKTIPALEPKKEEPTKQKGVVFSVEPDS